MGMTREERKAKYYLERLLRSNGYATYAKILDRFDVNYTSDPNSVAYMLPGKGVIVINRGVDAEQASVLVRHEILHEYLKHEKRLLDSLAKKRGLNRSELEDTPLKELDDELKQQLYSNQDFNIAADYEISNRGYTEKDKDAVRAIQINSRIVSGLVTEDDHPDWVNLSVEEMYDKLAEERANQPPPVIKGILMNRGGKQVFLDPVGGVMYGKK
jgi:hypothetical protein